jgi:2,4-dienoyl-CoA reductase-like NADH-dependent reductase (Old Yellow Enzyme family)
MPAYTTLLSPVSLGPLRLRNRVLSTSHQTTLVHDHLPTDALIAYHAARAAGGVGAIVIEATAVHPTGLLTPHTLGGYLPEIARGYRRLAEAVHAHDTRLLVQLFHGGREQFGAPPRPPAVAPSAVPSARFKSEPRALSARELREIVDGYAAAARLAREGDLDGIELSFSHGYLVPQFFSPATNLRTDGYGGELDGRLRLAREIIEAVRAGAGELAVGARLSADELAPGTLDARACAEITRALGGELDFVSFVLGHSASYAGSTWIAPPPPVAENAIASKLTLAREAAGATAVIATTRIVDLDDADELVASGAADAVGMTRALIADPDIVRKTISGAGDDVLECIGCNQSCIGHYHAGVPIGCVANPRTGRESTLPRPVRRARQRRVLVAGGGPAGVAAAIEAALAGDEVVLREREFELGGQLRLAGRAPAHVETWQRWLRTARRRLERLRVTVELGREVAVADVDDDVDGGSWDLVVVATGARAYVPVVGNVGGVSVLDGWSALASPASVRGPVLVADWGGEWTGLDAAEVLRAAGHEVELACGAIHPGETLHQYQRNLYLGRLDLAGVRIRHHTELALDTGRLRHVFSGRDDELPPVATVVLAQGRAPEGALWASLEGRPGCVAAGDVLGPRTLEEAVLEGTVAVR